jgi:hypothetical protein
LFRDSNALYRRTLLNLLTNLLNQVREFEVEPRCSPFQAATEFVTTFEAAVDSEVARHVAYLVIRDMKTEEWIVGFLKQNFLQPAAADFRKVLYDCFLSQPAALVIDLNQIQRALSFLFWQTSLRRLLPADAGPTHASSTEIGREARSMLLQGVSAPDFEALLHGNGQADPRLGIGNAFATRGAPESSQR